MALIEYKNVSVFHQDDDAVLNSIDFNVDEGEFIYIIGKVGSGKSSLLRTFYAELDIEEAEKAEVLGRDMMTIRRKDVPALRRELGIIFQNFLLLTDRSVSKNLEFVLRATGWEKDDIPGRIDEVLQSVGMEAAKDKMPYQLSGGEQQRIAIARSLLNNPKVILADEPTGALDSNTGRLIMDIFHKLHKEQGKTIVLITHSPELAEELRMIEYGLEQSVVLSRAYAKHYNSVSKPYYKTLNELYANKDKTLIRKNVAKQIAYEGATENFRPPLHSLTPDTITQAEENYLAKLEHTDPERAAQHRLTVETNDGTRYLKDMYAIEELLESDPDIIDMVNKRKEYNELEDYNQEITKELEDLFFSATLTPMAISKTM